jgi:hypothetical protein
VNSTGNTLMNNNVSKSGGPKGASGHDLSSAPLESENAYSGNKFGTAHYGP